MISAKGPGHSIGAFFRCAVHDYQLSGKPQQWEYIIATSTHPSPSSEAALILVPNPAGQFLEVSFPRETPGAPIDFLISDLQGRALVPAIFRAGEDRWTLDVSSMPNGM